MVVSEEVEPPDLPRETRAVQVPRDVMETISPMNAPQGALFLASLPDTALPERLEGARYLILDGLQDPGNVGTIWRTADALGADGLILINRCADPYGPKAVRASMGACFRLPVYEGAWEQVLPLLERSGLPVYAAALGEHTQDVKTADLPPGAGRLRPAAENSHARPLRVPQCRCGRRRHPVGDGALKPAPYGREAVFPPGWGGAPAPVLAYTQPISSRDTAVIRKNRA